MNYYSSLSSRKDFTCCVIPTPESGPAFRLDCRKQSQSYITIALSSYSSWALRDTKTSAKNKNGSSKNLLISPSEFGEIINNSTEDTGALLPGFDGYLKREKPFRWSSVALR